MFVLHFDSQLYKGITVSPFKVVKPPSVLFLFLPASNPILSVPVQVCPYTMELICTESKQQLKTDMQ